MPEMLQLMISFFQIGLFSIGGGYAMIPMIQSEMLSHGWMTMEEVADVVAISQMTPGPFAINSATFVGMRVAGLPGAILSTLGVILPSFIIVLIAARFFFKMQEKPGVKAVMYGMRPVVAALIASACITIALTALFLPDTAFAWSNTLEVIKRIDWRGIVIAAAALVALLKFKMHVILMIAASAVVGIVLYGFI